MSGEVFPDVTPRWLVVAAFIGTLSGAPRAFELYEQVRADRAAGLAALHGGVEQPLDPTAYPEM